MGHGGGMYIGYSGGMVVVCIGYSGAWCCAYMVRWEMVVCIKGTVGDGGGEYGA